MLIFTDLKIGSPGLDSENADNSEAPAGCYTNPTTACNDQSTCLNPIVFFVCELNMEDFVPKDIPYAMLPDLNLSRSYVYSVWNQVITPIASLDSERNLEDTENNLDDLIAMLSDFNKSSCSAIELWAQETEPYIYEERMLNSYKSYEGSAMKVYVILMKAIKVYLIWGVTQPA